MYFIHALVYDVVFVGVYNMKIKALSTLARVAAAALILSFLVLSVATSAQAGMIVDLNAESPGQNDIGNAITISDLSTSDFVDIMQIGVADGGSYNARLGFCST
jgi:hypothetical protein